MYIHAHQLSQSAVIALFPLHKSAPVSPVRKRAIESLGGFIAAIDLGAQVRPPPLLPPRSTQHPPRLPLSILYHTLVYTTSHPAQH